MTVYFWKGEVDNDSLDPANWYNPLNNTTGNLPADGDSIVFDATSTSAGTDCRFYGTFPASGELLDVTITNLFTKFIITSASAIINLDGKLSIDKTLCIKNTHALGFDFYNYWCYNSL